MIVTRIVLDLKMEVYKGEVKRCCVKLDLKTLGRER